ncbi:MAG: lactonase family protein [Opitutales bacterium]
MTDESQVSKFQIYAACNAGGAGVERLTLDLDKGSLIPAEASSALPVANFLAVDEPNGRLYAIGDGPADGENPRGRLQAFRLVGHEGQLEPVGEPRSTGGSSPCFVSVADGGRLVLVTNFRAFGGYGQPGADSKGGLAAYACVPATGALSDPSVLQNEGSGPHPVRQTNPHPHCVLHAPGGQHVYVADLGADRIWIYRTGKDVDGSPALVAAEPAFAVTPAGTGPRHLAFTPDGRFVYAISEISSAVLAFQREPDTGALQLLQEVSALPVDLPGGGGCADLHVHPSGRFLYASNRDNHAITNFTIDRESGSLRYSGYVLAGGECPRGFTLLPDGTHLLAANQETRNVVLFRLDPETGTATPTGVSANTTGKPIAMAAVPSKS